MINVGILGAETPQAGELLRLLLNHPDVKVRAVVSPSHADYSISSLHHGLIGDTSLVFTPEADLSKLDVVFLCSQQESEREKWKAPEGETKLNVIDLCSSFERVRLTDPLAVYGIPELNRKALVRGAKHAVIPSAAETVAAIALQPLAMRSMLPETLHVNLRASEDLLSLIPDDLHVLCTQLVAQTSAKPIKLIVEKQPCEQGRVISLDCDIPLDLPLDGITESYEQLYDDHNFTHIVAEEADPKEVEGTDKCIVSLDKGPDGRLRLRAIADIHLRGGAGQAVHVMNLLEGLYEKTGLALKASRF